MSSSYVTQICMWQTEDDVAVDDVANEAYLVKWMMNHIVRGTKTKKNKIRRETKIKKMKISRGTKSKKLEHGNSYLKTLVLPSSSCLSSFIFNGYA